ncbi:RICIN domain-containing protein [Kitasatospora sp. NPDC101235]|uniref:RICIN domain-containing protein n=1 Tax=Kitasatospora sp. NPDC101235 TaxID=3364101 RepID=UPI0037FECBFF
MTIRLRLPYRVTALAAALFAAVAAIPLTATAARAATPICISGAFQYDYQSADDGPAKPTRTKPLRNATVELWGSEQSTETPHALNVVGLTDYIDGSYNLCYTPTTTTSLSSVQVKAWAASNRLWWVYGPSEVYTMLSQAMSNISRNTNFGTTKAPASTAQAWHIADTLNVAWWNRANPKSICWSANETDGNTCTPLKVRWAPASPGSGHTQYDPANNIVYIIGADADSEHYILHEASHFLMHRLFNGPWSDSLTCQTHSIWRVSSEGCGWSEGFANAAAAYMLGDSRFVFGDGSSSEFAYGGGWDVGDQVEGNVAGSLLGLWRNVDNGWSGSIAAIAAQKPYTFSAYFNTARPAANPPLATDGAALGKLAPHTIDYGLTIIGDGKYHSLTDGGGMALERYGSCIAASGANATLGTLDTTRNWQRWKLDANTDGTVRISDGCTQPLTLTAPTAAGGAVTVKAFDAANTYQKWKVAKSNGTLKLTNPQTGLALDTTSFASGAITTVNSASSANSQSWAPVV